MTQLVTGEAVALDLRPAALPTRVLAALIDLGVQLVAFTISLFALVPASQSLSQATVAGMYVVVVVVVLAGYPIAFESLWRGRTPGKAALGLRVVRDDGGPIAFRQALVRGLAGTFLERPGITFFSGAVLGTLLNRRSKRLGDLLGGTIVLNERVPRFPTLLPPVPQQLWGWAQSLELSGLSEELAQSARTFLSRASDLEPAVRDDLARRLVASITAVVSPPPPTGTPGWAYLTAVLSERRRRAQVSARPAPSSPWQPLVDGVPVTVPRPTVPHADVAPATAPRPAAATPPSGLVPPT